MGALTKPQTKTVDPTPDAVKPLQGDLAGFLQGLIGGGAGVQNPFGGMTSDLQRQATGGVSQFLNANPEQQTFNMLSPGLLSAFGGGGAQGQALGALQPGLLGMFGRDNASAVGAAAMPLFQQGLQFAQGSLANSAPGRFSTTFANQGIGLGQRALQDFNLLQQQAFMQDQQNRLGAGGLLGQLAQGASGESLGAGGLLGTLAGQAGQGAFGRNLQAGQLGLGMTQQNVNPILQLLLGGMGFAQPMGKETIVGKSPLDVAGQIGGTFVSAGGIPGIGGLF